MTEPAVLWRPNPGPQNTFCAATEFECLYGGAKGGGKSDAILFAALRQVDKPLYKALILRETFPELEEIIGRANRVFPQLRNPPAWEAEQRRWRFPSGAIVKFGYCQYLKDVQRYQGGEWAYIGFDELGNVGDERIWIDLLKEIRCKDPAVRRMARASANPGYAGHPWIKRRFIEPCGKAGERVHTFRLELPNGITLTQQRRYVPARVTDNPTYANDPEYLATLYSLPEQRRRQLLEGDWDAGAGLALGELDRDVHLPVPFEIPAHWPRFAAFDWGFAHRWVFGAYAADEYGRVWKLDTVTGRRDLPGQIAAAIKDRFDVASFEYMVAGGDIFQRHQARAQEGVLTPTLDEQFQELGLFFVRADDGPGSRVNTLNNLRDYLKWRGQGEAGADGEPAFRLLKTPGNEWCFSQLESMVTDEKNPEDVLKVNCDPETGEGGDDAYDETRYALASRMWQAPKPVGMPALEDRVRGTLQEALARAAKRAAAEGELDESPVELAGEGWEGLYN